MHMTHCSESSGLSVCVCNNSCSPGPPYDGRKVGCDLEGVPSNARVVDATGSWSYIPVSLCVSSQQTNTHTHTHTHTHARTRGTRHTLQ